MEVHPGWVIAATCCVILVIRVWKRRAALARPSPCWNMDIRDGPTGTEFGGAQVFDCMGVQSARCYHALPLAEQLADGATLSVDGEQRPCLDDTFGNEQCGIATPYLIPQVAKSCLHNGVVGITNRVVAKIPVPDPEFIASFRAWVGDNVERLLGPPGAAKRCSFWLWARRYTLARQAQLWAALMEYWAGIPVMHYVLRIRAFLKRENIVKDEPSEPRVIMPRHDVYVAALGPPMLAISNYLAYAWGGKIKKGYPESERFDADVFEPLSIVTYASGYSRDQVGDWFDRSIAYVSDYGEPLAICSDFKRFDMSISTPLLQTALECDIHMGEFDAREAGLMRSQQWTYGTFAGHKKTGSLVWESVGGRHSGDVNTSNDNTLLNGLVLIHTLEQVFEGDPLELPVRAILLGDDIYMLLPRCMAWTLIAVLKDRYLKYGLRAKARLCAPREGDFCSSLFVPTARGTLLAPLPGRLLAKTFWSTHPLGERKKLGWVKGVIASVEPMCTVWPWVTELLHVMRRHIPSGTAVWKPRSNRKKGAIHFNSHGDRRFDRFTAEFVYWRYNLTRSEIQDFVEWVRSQDLAVDATVAHPLLKKVHEVDFGPSPAESPGD